MSKTRNALFTLLMTGTMLFFVASFQGALAQEDNSGGLFSGLFNKGATAAKPLYVKPTTEQQPKMKTGGSGRASQTGVATPSRSAGSSNLFNYQNVTEDQMDKMSIGEIIQMETERQTASTKQFRADKVAEAAEMAELYREQMQERLASQLDPSALQSMGAGGMGGVSEEQIKRKMIYKPKDDDATSTGKKPIRLFNVR